MWKSVQTFVAGKLCKTSVKFRWENSIVLPTFLFLFCFMAICFSFKNPAFQFFSRSKVNVFPDGLKEKVFRQSVNKRKVKKENYFVPPFWGVSWLADTERNETADWPEGWFMFIAKKTGEMKAEKNPFIQFRSSLFAFFCGQVTAIPIRFDSRLQSAWLIDGKTITSQTHSSVDAPNPGNLEISKYSDDKRHCIYLRYLLWSCLSSDFVY